MSAICSSVIRNFKNDNIFCRENEPESGWFICDGRELSRTEYKRLFDVIGTSVISANEASFHALNSKKIKGAKQGIYMIKNSNQISSICNDIVGDVCGIISGSIGAILAIMIYDFTGWNTTIISVVLAALISSFTVGGKAIFKIVAINHADNIILTVSKIIAIFGGNK